MGIPLHLCGKMRLLFIGNHFSGRQHNANVWQELVERLRGSGHSVITSSKHQNKILRVLDMLWTIWRRRHDYDIAEVDVFSGPAFTWADLSSRLIKLTGKPLVLSLHGGNLPAFAKQFPKKVRRLLLSADEVVAPSDYLVRQLQEYRDDIRLIPNGIDISRYPYRHRVQVKPNLVWLRAFHHIYNPELAIRSLALLKDGFPDIHLWMVGPDKGDGSLQNTIRLAKTLQVAERVEFIPGVAKSDVPLWLNKGDIFLNTSNYDNTPVSVMEAMACGLCPISTNVGGIPYLLKENVDALLVPPNDPEAMANAIRRVLTEPDLAARLSAGARHRAQDLDWSVILPKWETLFTEVIKSSNV